MLDDCFRKGLMCARLNVCVSVYKEDQAFFSYSSLNKAESLTLNSELTNMASPGSQCDLGILALWLPWSGTKADHLVLPALMKVLGTHNLVLMVPVIKHFPY